jgi:DNA-directed RNA polymerase subunit beta'
LLDVDVNNFDRLRIGLASSEQIRQWSRGEVKKPETINYRTLKPEKDGLFCEKIFGPTKDWECYCGKYKRVRFKGIICERCGVEVTRAKVRRDRMGHIELAAPVSHIWYFKGVPSRLGYLLDIAPKDLEKVLYFASYIITSVNDEDREADLAMLKDELDTETAGLDAEKADEVAQVEADRDRRIAVLRGEAEPEDGEEIDETVAVEDQVKKLTTEAKRDISDLDEEYEERRELIKESFETFQKLVPKMLVSDETLYRDMKSRYGNYFRGGMGAEAIKDLLERLNLDDLALELRTMITEGKGQKRQKAIKRLRVVAAFKSSKNRPEWMILDAVPVIPPDLRPMVQLDGGRFATSDLNDLYRRVINRNNRLKRLLDLGAPEIIVNNEKRMLQEAVDALFDNGRRGRPVTGPGNRPLKSLSDMLKGKQGRFRQNLLGKRVDYSGRSVIVVGPELKLHQCGLPKVMALELFKPFVMKRLVDLDHSQNIKSAKRMVDRGKAVVWDVLEEVIRDHPVMLNRAPTLHRLGIQAFEPILVEGKAIRLHPLVCTAFNADFDGDQMAVHLPLSAEAQAEARILMLSVNNIKSPAHGRPLATPTQDMVIGVYYLTSARPGVEGEGRVFYSFDEAILAYDNRAVDLQANIAVRLDADIVEEYLDESGKPQTRPRNEGERLETTIGRITFNRSLPADHDYINRGVDKKGVSKIVEDCSNKYSTTEMARILDEVKRLGFHYATRAGVTVSVFDALIPAKKAELIAEAEDKVATIEKQYDRGLITHDERHRQIVDQWTATTEEVGDAMAENFRQSSPFNPIYMMANSGARGNIKQVRQLAGMRGLMANPKGEILDRPIKANFREGLSVLEYFISTHGARKGLADTALRTADSGYLTRRLVDVAQDVIVREADCGTDQGVLLPIVDVKDPGRVDHDLVGRCLLTDVVEPKTGEVLKEAGGYVSSDSELDGILERGVEAVEVRAVMTCHAKYGICQKCYGWDLASGRPVDIGMAVGIIAAQSIGEPGTQLTMRTFHTGGVAGEDITHGLPRVTELFEARRPKGQAILAEIGGTLRIEDADKTRKLIVSSGHGPAESGKGVADIEKAAVAELKRLEAEHKADTKATIAEYGKTAAELSAKRDADLKKITADHKDALKKASDDEAKVALEATLAIKVEKAKADFEKKSARLEKQRGAALKKSEAAYLSRAKKTRDEFDKKKTAEAASEADHAKIHEKSYTVSRRARLRPGIADGVTVAAGAQLTEGSINPHELLELRGEKDVLSYIVAQVQDVYASQGVDINDKHIEVISRQMMRKVSVLDSGDTEFLPGQLVDRFLFEEQNERIIAEGRQPARAESVLLGITKASLATDSYLSAASFQETTRVLTDAAIAGKEDQLLGLKENVIIGKLIPAATGMKRYRSVMLTYKGQKAEWSTEETGGPLPEFAPEELKELEAMLPTPQALIEAGGLTEEEATAFFADLDVNRDNIEMVDFGAMLPAIDEDIAAGLLKGAVAGHLDEGEEDEDRCVAVTSSGAQCRNKRLEGGRYCRTHEGVAATDGLCKAIMKDGRPCPKKAKDGGDFCGQHAKLAEHA